MGAKMGAAAEGMFTGVLILSVVILSINMVFCLLRAVLGPRFSDRLIAINMIGTKTVLREFLSCFSLIFRAFPAFCLSGMRTTKIVPILYE